MKQPYENVYIGNFIFAMGFYAAKTQNGLSNKAIQLVQQTPDEQILNDLFLSWEGKNFIFEFKRNKKQIKTELDKPNKLKLNKALNDDYYKNASRLSKKAHLLGYGSDEGIKFIQYLNIHLDDYKSYTTQKVIANILNTNRDVGLTHIELKNYINFIGRVTNSEQESCGGFILNISKEGNLNMVPFDSINLLTQSLDVKPDVNNPEPENRYDFNPFR